MLVIHADQDMMCSEVISQVILDCHDLVVNTIPVGEEFVTGRDVVLGRCSEVSCHNVNEGEFFRGGATDVGDV